MSAKGDLSTHATAVLDQVKAELRSTGEFNISLVVSTTNQPNLTWLAVPQNRGELIYACTAIHLGYMNEGQTVRWAGVASDSYMLTAEDAGTEDLGAIQHGNLALRFDAGDPAVTEALSLWITYADGTTESRMMPYVRHGRRITFGTDVITKGRWSSITSGGWIPDCLAVAVGISTPSADDLVATRHWVARAVAARWPNQ